MPAGRARRLARWYATHARRALHRDLLDQPGRRRLQGLRPHLRRGAALDRDDARPRSARPGAASRMRGHGLALQPLRRARRGDRRDQPPPRAAAPPPKASAARDPAGRDAATRGCALRRQRAPHRAARLAGVRRPGRGARVQHRRHRAGRALRRRSTWRRSRSARPPTSRSSSASWAWCWRSARSPASCSAPAGCASAATQLHQAMWLALALAVPGCALLLVPAAVPACSPRPSPRSPPRCAATSAGSPFALPAGAALHRLSRLQHRGVAAEGGDGAAGRRRSR